MHIHRAPFVRLVTCVAVLLACGLRSANAETQQRPDTRAESPADRLFVAAQQAYEEADIALQNYRKLESQPMSVEELRKAPTQKQLADRKRQAEYRHQRELALILAADSFESLVAKYPKFARADEVLFKLGRCKRNIFEGSAEGDAYIAAHPLDYQHFEGAGTEYTGRQFRQLLQMYPRSRFAMEAAFELTSITRAGEIAECETRACALQKVLDRFEVFLTKYSGSEHVRSAIKEINGSIDPSRGLPGAGDELSVPNGGPGRQQFLFQLNRYRTLTKMLARQDRTAAATAIGTAYQKVGEAQLARETISELRR